MKDTILEKDTIVVEIGDDHSFNCTAVTIGRTGENSVTQLEMVIPAELNTFEAYLDFKKPRGSTVKTGNLPIVDNKIEYDLPNGLLDENGNLEVQLVLYSENGDVWKSATKKFVVLKSIDATVNVPVVEDFIADAVETLHRLEEVSEGTLEYVDETYTTKAKASALEKRIINLEQDITPSPFEIDNAIAYQKDVPENVLPYAEVSSVGGMTRKCESLIPYPYYHTSKTENGITYTDNGDGSVTMNGTSTAETTFVFALNIPMIDSVSYVLSCTCDKALPNGLLMLIRYLDAEGVVQRHYAGGGAIVWNKNYTTSRFYVSISPNVTISNLTIYPMLNKGTTTLPYEPYYDGLRSASVTEVESVGKNFLDLEALANTSNWLISGYQYCSFPLYLKPNTKYTFSRKDDSVATAVFALFSRTPNSNQAGTGGAWFVYPNSTDLTKKVVTITTGDNGMMYMNLYYTPTAISALVALIGDAQLELGDTATPYKPYVRNTLPIPTEVQSLDGYGWGINESVYNYIDFEKKKFVKRVGCVDMGTLDWSYNGEGKLNASYTQLKEYIASSTTKPTMLCSKYENITPKDWYNKVNIGISQSTNGYGSPRSVLVYDSAYTDATTFKSAMSGVMLYYELAEPIVTDISKILSEDNLISVESNGTITFKNEYEHVVPNEITYHKRRNSNV